MVTHVAARLGRLVNLYKATENEALSSRVKSEVLRKIANYATAEADYFEPATKPILTENEKLVLKSSKIEAIKLVRNRTGLGLKEAKDIVDAYCAANSLWQ